VRDATGTVSCPAAPLVAAALRAAGLRAYVGPVHTADHLVDGPGRAELAATGALAVDTESAPLVRAAGDRPRLVVRAVADTPGRPLRSAGTVPGGIAALRALRRAAPVLGRWAGTLGEREVVLASPRAFCAGVERAVEVVERALDRHGAPVYVRRQIVHNAHVVADLERRGAVFVDELAEVPDAGTVVFSAHGVAPSVRAEAARRGLPVLDATCPLVAKVHVEARRAAARGDTVLLVGHPGHDEVEGTVGEVPGMQVVSTPEQVADLRVEDPEHVTYLTQTTLAVDEAQIVASALRQAFPAITGPPTDDICYATTNRQAAVRAVAARTDLVVVLGSANSSNSQRLVEVAERQGGEAVLVDDPAGLDLGRLTGRTSIGVTAGASAPPALVDELVTALAGLGRVRTTEFTAAVEDVRFTLPKEVG
jgi:4-hydroxy-3-methylbut-2-enyl diphosphate reductase